MDNGHYASPLLGEVVSDDDFQTHTELATAVKQLVRDVRQDPLPFQIKSESPI